MLSLPLSPLVSFKMKEGPFFRFLVSFKRASVHLCTHGNPISCRLAMLVFRTLA
jgi:hypothetical protein